MAHTANDSPPYLREGLTHPFGQRSTTGVAQSPHRDCDALIVGEVVLDGRSFLRLRELWFTACLAHRQVELALVLVVPTLQRTLRRVAQLPDGGPATLAQLDVELSGSDSSFVGIHELLSGSPSFCPHPPVG